MFEGKKKPHIKKPLNAFMLYMKEMRPKVRMKMITMKMMMTMLMNKMRLLSRIDFLGCG